MIVYQPIGAHYEPVQSLGMGWMRAWVSGEAEVVVAQPNRFHALTGPNNHPYTLIGPDPMPHVLTGPQSEPHRVTI